MRARVTEMLKSIASSSVAVIGDVMLDEYIIGDSTRISPEAPQPIIRERERTYVPGGAANVAVNVTSLGGKSRLFGIVGNDIDGGTFREKLRDAHVDDSGIIPLDNRPTCRKTRMISRGNQVLRVDHEVTDRIDVNTENRLVEAVTADDSGVVVVSDYAKGTVTPGLVKKLVATGKKVIIDPKTSDYGQYAGAFLITPNLGEFLMASELTDTSTESIESAARPLMKAHDIANLLVTLGPDGMLIIESDGPATHIHTRAREVYDVTGAGDTVIATVAASVASGASLGDACSLAAISAAIVVGKHQTATATPGEIIDYAFGTSASAKIVDRATLVERVGELKRAGRKVVFTNGCFDILHMGHITYLNDARGLGDILVVGVNTDASVQRLKGDSRPIIPEQERTHVLAALESIGYVVLFDEDTPLELISAVKPDVLVKGADYTKEEVVGYDVVESYGGEVRLIPLVESLSTSTIIERIKTKG